ncbi:MAG: thiolase family protein [Thermoplasmata archaeon]
MGGLEEVYVIEALRSPIGKRNGLLSGLHAQHLLAQVLQKTVEKSGIDPASTDHFIAGCVDQIGEQGANVARNSWLTAGFAETVPATTIDRQCGSSLQAVQFAYGEIASGVADLEICAGIESMSRVPMFSNIKDGATGTPITPEIRSRYSLEGEWFSQARAASLISEKYGISRTRMDEFSMESHMRASRSRKFADREKVPINTGREIISIDEGIRDSVSLEKMGSLKPAFPGIDHITAGNSSQISDGASACVLASKSIVDSMGLKPIARLVSFGYAAVDPIIMLTGVIPATKMALSRAGLKKDDIDIFEVNEAFASVPLAWEKELGVENDIVNPMGGAIALGHPLGATGTRIVSTLINGLHTLGGKRGLIAVCEGGGLSNACVIEKV